MAKHRITAVPRFVLTGWLLAICCMAAPLVFPDETAHAQGCTSDDPPCPANEPPGVSLGLASGALNSPNLSFYPSASDDRGLNTGTLSVVVKRSPGLSVTGQWEPGNVGWSGHATVTITV